MASRLHFLPLLLFCQGRSGRVQGASRSRPRIRSHGREGAFWARMSVGCVCMCAVCALNTRRLLQAEDGASSNRRVSTALGRKEESDKTLCFRTKMLLLIKRMTRTLGSNYLWRMPTSPTAVSLVLPPRAPARPRCLPLFPPHLSRTLVWSIFPE